MENFASIDDVIALWREITPEEGERAKYLLPIIADSLREEAIKVGKDLDAMVKERTSFANVAKSVVVDVLARALLTSTDSEPMIQMAESALGYASSGTFLVPGGGLFIKKSELARLGLRRQKMGCIDMHGN